MTLKCGLEVTQGHCFKVTLSCEAVARSKQLLTINSSSSLSLSAIYRRIICNDVHYDTRSPWAELFLRQSTTSYEEVNDVADKSAGGYEEVGNKSCRDCRVVTV